MVDYNKGFVKQIKDLVDDNKRLLEKNKNLVAENHELTLKIIQLEAMLNSEGAKGDGRKFKRAVLVLFFMCALVAMIFANVSSTDIPASAFHFDDSQKAYNEGYQGLYRAVGQGVYIENDDIGPDFYRLTNELNAFISQFGDTVAVFYENLETGFTFSHNGDRVFFGASATKAPFALYIFQKAERGETDLNSVHTFTQADFWEGSGVIRHRYSVGATFTQHRLLYLMLAPSDNIATRMLRRIHGLEGYRYFIQSIGGDPHFVQNITYSYISANEAGIIMRELYRYINSGGIYSLQLKQHLLSNRYPFITSYYPVASKSGWASNFGRAWHDMAIVFAPSPYTLTLLSSRSGTQADRQVYNAISQFIQEFNDYWFTD